MNFLRKSGGEHFLEKCAPTSVTYYNYQIVIGVKGDRGSNPCYLFTPPYGFIKLRNHRI